MTSVKTNIWNLKVGDKISFTNYFGIKKEKTITRVTEKSWFCPNRNSFGTFADYEKSFKDFKIIRDEENV
jgi:hypothetical protein